MSCKLNAVIRQNGLLFGQMEKSGPPGPGVPAGGTPGQVLSKRSLEDYDTKWIDLAGGGNVISKEVRTIKALTLSEYESISQKDPSTLYLISG